MSKVIHPKLVHLSQEQLRKMVEEYYAGEKIKSLLTKYEIYCAPGSFHRILPPQVLDHKKCPSCGAPMIKPLPCRGVNVLPPPICCSQCEHGEIEGCRCEYCQMLRETERQAQLQEQAAVINNYISTYFTTVTLDVEAKDLSLRDAVALLALIRTCGYMDEPPLNSMGVLAPLQWSTIPFSPRSDSNNELIQHLVRRRIVCPSNHSAKEAFTFEGGAITGYSLSRVKWKINCKSPQVIVRGLEDIALSGDWPSGWEAEVKSLWLELAFYECWEFYEYSAKTRGLSITDGPSLDAMLKNFLRDYSVAQCYRVIGVGAKDAVDFRARKLCSVRHAANYMIGACQRWADRARAEGWEVFPYRRNFDLPRSMTSYVLHDVFLKIGDRGFTETPKLVKPEPDIAVMSASDNGV